MTSTAKKFLVNFLYALGIIAAILLIWYVTSLAVDSELIEPNP